MLARRPPARTVQPPSAAGAHRLDARPEAAARQPLGDPAVVGLELAPQDVQALVEVEAVQALAGVQVAQEGVRARRVGERHEVGEERHLDLRLVEHEAGVPRELRAWRRRRRASTSATPSSSAARPRLNGPMPTPTTSCAARHAATAMRGARVQPSSTRVRSGEARAARSPRRRARGRARASACCARRARRRSRVMPNWSSSRVTRWLTSACASAAAEQLGRADEQVKAAVARAARRRARRADRRARGRSRRRRTGCARRR